MSNLLKNKRFDKGNGLVFRHALKSYGEKIQMDKAVVNDQA